jgi:hypothetical protein
MNKRLILWTLVLLGCGRHPSNRLTDLASEGAVPTASADWVLYSDELQTGGGFYLIPDAGSHQILDGDRTESYAGRASVRYSWTGAAILGQHDFAGFGFLVAPTIDKDASTPARDLSEYGFTRITFMAKGTLSENTLLRVEGPCDGTGSTVAPRLEISREQLAAGWTQYSMPVPDPISFASIKQYINFVFIYSQPTGTTKAGDGGTIFIDQVTYAR